MWYMTHKGGEYCLKMSGPKLLRFGSEGVLKIFFSFRQIAALKLQLYLLNKFGATKLQLQLELEFRFVRPWHIIFCLKGITSPWLKPSSPPQELELGHLLVYTQNQFKLYFL